MTRNERAAISILNAYKEGYESAIEDYKQEPCDDAVSREDAREAFSKWFFDRKDLRTVDEVVDKLPPVTQKSESVTEFADRCRECGAKYGKLLKQKSGKWINDKNDMPICSQCGYIPQFDRAIDDYEYSNYCPSCGCRMVDPQESEE